MSALPYFKIYPEKKIAISPPDTDNQPITELSPVKQRKNCRYPPSVKRLTCKKGIVY